MISALTDIMENKVRPPKIYMIAKMEFNAKILPVNLNIHYAKIVEDVLMVCVNISTILVPQLTKEWFVKKINVNLSTQESNKINQI